MRSCCLCQSSELIPTMTFSLLVFSAKTSLVNFIDLLLLHLRQQNLHLYYCFPFGVTTSVVIATTDALTIVITMSILINFISYTKTA